MSKGRECTNKKAYLKYYYTIQEFSWNSPKTNLIVITKYGRWYFLSSMISTKWEESREIFKTSVRIVVIGRDRVDGAVV